MDEFLRDYCPFSVHQKRAVFGAGLVAFLNAFPTVVLVFIGTNPAWHCREDDRTSELGTVTDAEYLHVSRSTSLHAIASIARSKRSDCERLALGECSVTYEEPWATASAEFGLICEHEAASSYAQSFYFFGMLLGSWLSGWCSDMYGRRRALLLGLFVATLASLWTTITSSFATFALSRFAAGVGVMCAGVVNNIVASEAVAPSYRSLTTSLMHLGFCLGMTVTPALAYAWSDNWRVLMRNITLITMASSALVYVWVCETPFWLQVHKKQSELRILLTRWVASSGNTVPERVLNNVITGRSATTLSRSRTEIGVESETGRHDAQYAGDVETVQLASRTGQSLAQLKALLSPGLRFYSLSMLWVWFSICVMYYGLIMHLDGVGSNKYISFFLLAAVEIPSSAAVIVALRHVGRKSCIFWCLVMTTVFCACSAFIALLSTWTDSEGTVPAFKQINWQQSVSNWQLTVSICGKFAASAAFSVLYTYVPELLPTPIRTSGLSVCVTVSRAGAIMSPLVLSLAQSHHATAPYLVYVLFGTMSCLAIYGMPETRHRGLPDTVQDLHRLIGSPG
eukprot:scpid40477/ scgid6059/ Solute carrier family 22 member 13; Organic cation transporter-like 3